MKILNTPAMRRMPTYLHQLFHLRLSGQEWVSCADLAKYMSIPHVMVRKDIGMTGLPGNKRHGFKVNDLIDAILRFVGWDKPSSATLVGAGSLGAAILNFDDFRSYNFIIESVFDSSPEKICPSQSRHYMRSSGWSTVGCRYFGIFRNKIFVEFFQCLPECSTGRDRSTGSDCRWARCFICEDEQGGGQGRA